MRTTQRKQTLVKLENQDQDDKFIAWLENSGFENVQNLTFDKLTTKVLVIENNIFFGTNATVLACFVNCDVTPITVEQFKKL